MNAEGTIVLIADRFVVADQEGAIDLATGRAVALVCATAGGHAEEARWSLRCDRLMRLRQRWIAPLIDYGPFGEMKRFEAWACDPHWEGTASEAARAVGEAVRFLRANGLTCDGIGAHCVRASNGRPVIVPDAASGYEAEPVASCGESLAAASCGVALIERKSVHALAELFAPPFPSHPRAVACWAPPGGGMSTAILELARAARQQGFVPRSVGLASRSIRGLLQGRSLCLINRSPEPAIGWAALLNATLDAKRPHVLMFAGGAEVSGVPGIPLGRVPPEALCAAVRPFSVPGAVMRRAERCAEHAKGLPGRFARLFWHERHVASHRVRVRPALISMAAERPIIVAGVQSHPFIAERSSMATELRPWPAPAELAALRRRLDAGVAALDRGHHVPGERDVRAAAAGLIRRGDQAHAIRGYVALASTLLRRGRPREVQTIIAEARQGPAAEHQTTLIELGILAGTAALDLGRLDEAEHLLHAAVLGSAHDSHGVDARLALARCLFWRGRFIEADHCLNRLQARELNAVDQVRVAIALSGNAVGRRDPAVAVARAADAVRGSEALQRPALGCRAYTAAAFAHLTVSDRDAVARDIACAVRYARLAHDPLAALRARLLGAESERRAGSPRVATALIARVFRLSASNIPPIVRARCALLGDLLSASSADEIVRRHVAMSGLEALPLFAPSVEQAAAPGLATVVAEVLEILRFSQTSEDDVALLTRICARLRGRLRASGVAFYVAEGTSVTPVASDGGRVDPQIAGRVADSGLAIAPHARDGAIEAASPVRLSGDIVGMLVARWALGGMGDAAGAGVMMTMAAAAAAPAVAAVLSHRRQRVPASGDLLGVSAAINAVRQAVERAAAAPFAVLIEGESGSGKEVVARALHRRSTRRDKPFGTLNCAALPDDLVEAELFGHARGAFTGAVTERAGVFEEAHTGTLFLDEIGELSPRAQAKLLRTIQEGEVRRVGENVSRRVDVRVVAATNRDLKCEVEAGRFRLDLFYRLDVLRVSIPPLRDRREDIAVLADHFWRDAAGRVGSRAVLATATVAALSRYHWPGNVRELQNVLAALAVRSPRRGVVPPTALPSCFASQPPADTWKLDTARRTFEERFVRAALVRTGGHRGRAAEELGVTRQGLTKLMVRLGIEAASP